MLKMGCRVCRARKVKCDGRPNGCRNCERLQLDCLDEDGAASTVRSPTAPRKIRTYRSCAACRLSKTKCDGERPKCSRCTDKAMECQYDGGAAPRWTKSLNEKTPSINSDEERSPRAVSNVELQQKSLPSVFTSEDGSSVIPHTGLRQNRLPSVFNSQDGSNAAPAGSSMPYQGTAEFMAPGTMTPISDMPPPSRPLSRHESFSSFQILPSDSTAWLMASELPNTRNLRRIIETYFANVHPLRCFAFVHKPSFLRQLDKGFTTDDENALLHIVCAHGAKFHVLMLNQTDQAPGMPFQRAAGNQWAKKAESLILANFGKVSIQKLMAVVLLYDYQFRLGDFTQALMTSGLAVRMAHALKINTEFSNDILCTDTDQNAPSIVARESRRRLMWACYVLDAWTGSGMEQLTLLRESDIKIQLPCNERNFGLRIASVTETLGVGHVLQFLSPADVPPRPAANMGIMAYYVRIVALWKRVVKFTKLLATTPAPWHPESEFSALDGDLRRWRRELPEFVEYSADTIYARLDSNQLGSLMLIHCTYHHNFLELYKFSMPDLFKLEKGLSFPPEQTDFIKVAQADAYFHAQKIAEILAEAADHGSRLLSDALLPFFVYDSSRVMLYYVSHLLDPDRVDALALTSETVKAVQSNKRILTLMSALFPIAEPLAATIDRWLQKIRKSLNRKLGHSQSPPDETSGAQEPLTRATTAATASTRVTPDLAMTPIQSIHRSGIGEKRDLSGNAVSRDEAKQPSPSWDHHTTAAHGLVGLSQNATPSQSILHHERPVEAMQTDPVESHVMKVDEEEEVLDIDDLSSFFPWDMYGLMEIGEAMSHNGGDDQSKSWGGDFY